MGTTSLNWAILATGRIARAFADGVNKSETGRLVAVGSRSYESATLFAQEFGGKPYGSYTEALADPDVQAVYIATPHHLHADLTVEAAQAGKHVLVEKPCALNHADAARAVAACQENDVLFCEAFMYRLQPQMVELVRQVREGVIGTIRHIQVDFGFAASRDWKDSRTVLEYGAGGLMDVGCYCISFAQSVLGETASRSEYAFERCGEGYDGVGTGILQFASGATANFGTGIHINLRNQATIYGDLGHITVEEPWFCNGKFTIHLSGQDPQEVVVPALGLYANEADVFAAGVEGRVVPHWTHENSLANLATMDALRLSGGLRFGAHDPLFAAQGGAK
ncbi:MAG: Gfo/Idh/MocA family oxidoreductase [Armatimonadetes bacterium]|nr:Gfo/Idh/MocA family oxidoreductase [Armatimonadota bacterium]